MDKRLNQNGLLTNAKIVDYELGYRGGISFIYTFQIKGMSFLNKTSFPELVSNHPKDFIGKYFPVIYLPNNISYNELLISRYSFNKFNIQFPDTLVWVTKYEK